MVSQEVLKIFTLINFGHLFECFSPGQCATVAFDENEAFFVYFMVDEDRRGQGIGEFKSNRSI